MAVVQLCGLIFPEEATIIDPDLPPSSLGYTASISCTCRAGAGPVPGHAPPILSRGFLPGVHG